MQISFGKMNYTDAYATCINYSLVTFELAIGHISCIFRKTIEELLETYCKSVGHYNSNW